MNSLLENDLGKNILSALHIAYLIHFCKANNRQVRTTFKSVACTGLKWAIIGLFPVRWNRIDIIESHVLPPIKRAF